MKIQAKREYLSNFALAWNNCIEVMLYQDYKLETGEERMDAWHRELEEMRIGIDPQYGIYFKDSAYESFFIMKWLPE